MFAFFVFNYFGSGKYLNFQKCLQLQFGRFSLIRENFLHEIRNFWTLMVMFKFKKFTSVAIYFKS